MALESAKLCILGGAVFVVFFLMVVVIVAVVVIIIIVVIIFTAITTAAITATAAITTAATTAATTADITTTIATAAITTITTAAITVVIIVIIVTAITTAAISAVKPGHQPNRQPNMAIRQSFLYRACDVPLQKEFVLVRTAQMDNAHDSLELKAHALRSIAEGSSFRSSFIHASTDYTKALQWHIRGRDSRGEQADGQFLIAISIEDWARDMQAMGRDFNKEHYVIDVSSTSAQQEFFGTNDFRKKMGYESIAAVVSRLFHKAVEEWMPMLHQATKDSEVLIKWRGAVPITCMWKLDSEGHPQEQLWEWLVGNRPRLAGEILHEHETFLSPSEYSPLKVRLHNKMNAVSIPRPPPPPPRPQPVAGDGGRLARGRDLDHGIPLNPPPRPGAVLPPPPPGVDLPLPPPGVAVLPPLPPGVGVPGATAAPAAPPANRRPLPRNVSKAAAPAAAQEPPAGAAGAPLPPQPSYPGTTPKARQPQQQELSAGAAGAPQPPQPSRPCTTSKAPHPYPCTTPKAAQPQPQEPPAGKITPAGEKGSEASKKSEVNLEDKVEELERRLKKIKAKSLDTKEPPAGAAREPPPPPQDLIQMVRTLQHWSADIKNRKRESFSFQRLSDPLQKFITDAQSLVCVMKRMEKRMVDRMSAQIIKTAEYPFMQPCSDIFSHHRQNAKRLWAAPVAVHTRQLAAEIHLRRRAIPPPRSGGRLGGGGRPVGGRGHGRSSPDLVFGHIFCVEGQKRRDLVTKMNAPWARCVGWS